MSLRPWTKASRGHNRYCGPAALSALTGLDTAQAAALLRQVSGRKAVMGTSPMALRSALAHLGYSLCSTFYGIGATKPTLGQWAKRHAQPGVTYLVLLTGHWAVLRNRSYADNHHTGVVPLKQAYGRRKRVVTTWAVTEPVICKTNVKEFARMHTQRTNVQTTVQRTQAKCRREALKLIEAHGLKLDRERPGEYYLWPADNLCDTPNDPCSGNHFCIGWDEVLRKARKYVEVLS